VQEIRAETETPTERAAIEAVLTINAKGLSVTLPPAVTGRMMKTTLQLEPADAVALGRGLIQAAGVWQKKYGPRIIAPGQVQP
jgi:hypothetical protein